MSSDYTTKVVYDIEKIDQILQSQPAPILSPAKKLNESVMRLESNPSEADRRVMEQYDEEIEAILNSL